MNSLTSLKNTMMATVLTLGLVATADIAFASQIQPSISEKSPCELTINLSETKYGDFDVWSRVKQQTCDDKLILNIVDQNADGEVVTVAAGVIVEKDRVKLKTELLDLIGNAEIIDKGDRTEVIFTDDQDSKTSYQISNSKAAEVLKQMKKSLKTLD